MFDVPVATVIFLEGIAIERVKDANGWSHRVTFRSRGMRLGEAFTGSPAAADWQPTRGRAQDRWRSAAPSTSIGKEQSWRM
jgi:hypothetical protein